MERNYPRSERTETLSTKDIIRTRRHLLEPAVALCDVDISAQAVVLYNKESNDMSPGEDGMDYYYSFHATEADPMTGEMRFCLTEEVTESMTLDQLTSDDCNRVRLQFQEEYVAAGHQINDINKSQTWRALFTPEVFSRVSLAVVSTKAYIFSGDEATTTLTVERQLKVQGEQDGEEEVTVLDAFYLDEKGLDPIGNIEDRWLTRPHLDDRDIDVSNEDDSTEEDDKRWPAKYFAILDITAENMLAMTKKDQEEVIMILNELHLLPQQRSSPLFRER